jgi:hypothetical protein
MIAVFDLDGNFSSVPASTVQSNSELYSALRSSYHLTNIRLFVTGRELRNDATPLPPGVLSGDCPVGLVRDSPELPPLPKPSAVPRCRRFGFCHFLRPTPALAPGARSPSDSLSSSGSSGDSASLSDSTTDTSTIGPESDSDERIFLAILSGRG